MSGEGDEGGGDKAVAVIEFEEIALHFVVQLGACLVQQFLHFGVERLACDVVERNIHVDHIPLMERESIESPGHELRRRRVELLRLSRRDYREFVLESKAGTVFVSPHGNWVAVRFSDSEAAAKLVGTSSLNTHSGKWNHNYFAFPLDEAVSDVAHWLKRIAIADCGVK